MKIFLTCLIFTLTIKLEWTILHPCNATDAGQRNHGIMEKKMATWKSTGPVTGSTAIVTNGEVIAMASVRWQESQPKLYGAVYHEVLDSEGNRMGDVDGLPLTRVIDRNPVFA